MSELGISGHHQLLNKKQGMWAGSEEAGPTEAQTMPFMEMPWALPGDRPDLG